MSSEEFQKLMRRGHQLQRGPEQVAAFEAAVREADRLNDLDAGFEAREELVGAGTFGGAAEKALVAFSWCLARYDEDPERFGGYMLLWSYKWVIGNITNFPTISRPQIEELQNEMERRYREEGFGMRPVHDARMCNAVAMGDPEAALEHYREWKKAPRDAMSDCQACDRHGLVWLNVRLGRNAKALQLARPIFDGRMSCARIPAATHAEVLLPLLRLKRFEEAAEHHARGYHLVRRNPDFLSESGDHLYYLAAIGNRTKGLRVLERHWPWAIESGDPSERFDFYLGAVCLLELLERQNRRTRKVKVPLTLPFHRDDNTYAVAELADWVRAEVDSLAEQFDRRNGNSWHRDLLQKQRRLAEKTQRAVG